MNLFETVKASVSVPEAAGDTAASRSLIMIIPFLSKAVKTCVRAYKRTTPNPGAGCTHVRTNARIMKSVSLQSLKEEQTQWQYRSTRSCAL